MRSQNTDVSPASKRFAGRSRSFPRLHDARELACDEKVLLRQLGGASPSRDSQPIAVRLAQRGPLCLYAGGIASDGGCQKIPGRVRQPLRSPMPVIVRARLPVGNQATDVALIVESAGDPV